VRSIYKGASLPVKRQAAPVSYLLTKRGGIAINIAELVDMHKKNETCMREMKTLCGAEVPHL